MPDNLDGLLASQICNRLTIPHTASPDQILMAIDRLTIESRRAATTPVDCQVVGSDGWQNFCHWVREQQQSLLLEPGQSSEFEKIKRVVGCLLDNETKAIGQLKILQEDVCAWMRLILMIAETIQGPANHDQAEALQSFSRLILMKQSAAAPEKTCGDSGQEVRHWIVTAEAILSEMNLLAQLPRQQFVTPEIFRSLLLKELRDRPCRDQQEFYPPKIS